MLPRPKVNTPKIATQEATMELKQVPSSSVTGICFPNLDQRTRISKELNQ